MAELGVGIVGCGFISGIYLENMPSFAGIKAVACTDIIPERSAAKAAAHGIAHVTPDEILKRDDVDIILNITPPQVHYEVSLAALSAGKHVFAEKPVAVDAPGIRSVMQSAQLQPVAREPSMSDLAPMRTTHALVGVAAENVGVTIDTDDRGITGIRHGTHLSRRRGADAPRGFTASQAC